MNKVDWTKPIESTLISQHTGKVPVIYCGPQTMRDGKPITDEFKHLVLLGVESRANYVDDFGRTKGPNQLRTLVKNVADKMPEPKLYKTPSAAIDGGAIVLAEELRELRSEFETYAADFKPLLFGLAEAIRKLGTENKDALSSLRKELTEGLLLVAQEQQRPKPEAAEPEPVQRPKPTVVRDLTELGRAVGGAPIKGAEVFERQPILEVLKTIALSAGVKKLIIAPEYDPTSRMTRGQIKYLGEMDGYLGIKIKAYGEERAHVVYVYCEKECIPSLIGVVRSKNWRQA